MQEDEKVEEINSQASCDVMASHALFAKLSKEIGGKYPELAALIPEISKVAKAVVAAPKVTASPAEKREESLQALRKATNRSSAAEETMRKHNKKLEAAKKALEDLQAKTADLEEKRKEAYVELVRAQEGVAATRMAAPSGNGMDVDDDVDEADLRVRAAEMELARAKEEPAAKRWKTNVSECDGSAKAQAELERACVDANRAGKPSVWVMVTCASCRQTSPRGVRRPKGSCGAPKWDAFRPWHSQSTMWVQTVSTNETSCGGRRASAALQQQQKSQ